MRSYGLIKSCDLPLLYWPPKSHNLPLSCHSLMTQFISHHSLNESWHSHPRRPHQVICFFRIRACAKSPRSRDLGLFAHSRMHKEPYITWCGRREWECHDSFREWWEMNWVMSEWHERGRLCDLGVASGSEWLERDRWHERSRSFAHVQRVNCKRALYFHKRALYFHNRALSCAVDGAVTLVTISTTKEPYISAKEPYISTKEPYISTTAPIIVLQMASDSSVTGDLLLSHSRMRK